MEDFKNWIKDNTRKEAFEIQIDYSERERVQTIIWKEGCCMIEITGY
ncbi:MULTISPECIES: hypothetical protein [Clostridium]|nr:hypothetical protein [Clostridium sporogenes]